MPVSPGELDGVVPDRFRSAEFIHARDGWVLGRSGIMVEKNGLPLAPGTRTSVTERLQRVDTLVTVLPYKRDLI